jgi:hypothetical protein
MHTGCTELDSTERVDLNLLALLAQGNLLPTAELPGPLVGRLGLLDLYRMSPPFIYKLGTLRALVELADRVAGMMAAERYVLAYIADLAGMHVDALTDMYRAYGLFLTLIVESSRGPTREDMDAALRDMYISGVAPVKLPAAAFVFPPAPAAPTAAPAAAPAAVPPPRTTTPAARTEPEDAGTEAFFWARPAWHPAAGTAPPTAPTTPDPTFFLRAQLVHKGPAGPRVTFSTPFSALDPVRAVSPVTPPPSPCVHFTFDLGDDDSDPDDRRCNVPIPAPLPESEVLRSAAASSATAGPESLPRPVPIGPTDLLFVAAETRAEAERLPAGCQPNDTALGLLLYHGQLPRGVAICAGKRPGSSALYFVVRHYRTPNTFHTVCGLRACRALLANLGAITPTAPTAPGAPLRRRLPGKENRPPRRF